jgi:hypothetical protein
MTCVRVSYLIPPRCCNLKLLLHTHCGRRIEEDRGHAIEASAVRIMKARKVLTHQLLVGEVLSQLSFFQPNPRVSDIYVAWV